MKKKLLSMVLLAMFLSFSLVNVVSAAGLWDGIDSCRQDGDCTLDNFVQLGINVAYIILGLVGSLALLFFVYGGIMMIISAGSQERVSQAKTILINAVIGLAIVFISWLIVYFVQRTLGVGSEYLIK